MEARKGLENIRLITILGIVVLLNDPSNEMAHRVHVTP